MGNKNEKKNYKLLLINTAYPFDYGETFLESEIEYYDFEEVFIYPYPANKASKTNLPLNSNVTIIKNSKNITKIKKLLYTFKCFTDKEFYIEIQDMLKSKKFNLRTLKTLLSFMWAGEYYAHSLSKELKKIESKGNNIILYAYWMHITAFIAAKTKNEYKNIAIRTICRCHRYDVYEYRHEKEYIPFRKYIFSNMDKICCISDDSRNYLTSKYPEFKEKLSVNRLGTKDYGFDYHEKHSPLSIVSCSWMRPVKRVMRILDAISQLGCSVRWTHYGDGEEFEGIKLKAENYISEKGLFQVDFKGATPNSQVIEHYQRGEYDLFINVSESEGVPVSIMEAISFGIPVIATDVGGTNEIVINNKNGFLLEKDFEIVELVNAIRKINSMKKERYENMCISSRRIWEERCDASKNYSNFISELIQG